MKTIRLIAAGVILAAIFAVSAFAQTTASKIGLINTLAFDDEKAGITKYVAAMNSLDAEFKTVYTELQTLATKIQALQKEIAGYQDIINKGGKIPIADADLQKKLEEYDKLGREYKFKEEDTKARIENRERIVMGPIRADIGNALQEFTKKNGFTVVFDISKLGNAGVLLGYDDTADVTKQFIAFYNARPATTPVVPK